jgi:hypothetical protein
MKKSVLDLPTLTFVKMQTTLYLDESIVNYLPCPVNP